MYIGQKILVKKVCTEFPNQLNLTLINMFQFVATNMSKLNIQMPTCTRRCSNICSMYMMYENLILKTSLNHSPTFPPFLSTMYFSGHYLNGLFITIHIHGLIIF